MLKFRYQDIQDFTVTAGDYDDIYLTVENEQNFAAIGEEDDVSVTAWSGFCRDRKRQRRCLQPLQLMTLIKWNLNRESIE